MSSALLEKFERFNSPQSGFLFKNTKDNFQYTYRLGWGDRKTAAIYQPEHARKVEYRHPTVWHLIWCLRHDMLDTTLLLDHVKTIMNPNSQITKSMEALSIASKLYRVLPTATCSINALNNPLSKTKWASKALTCELSRSIALSGVAYVVSKFDIDPDRLSSVDALAFENPLYIAMPVCFF